MAKLKIFLMTRNDLIFIEEWIIYHGYLFGLENLYIVDGSDDPEVLAVYDFYKVHGLNVHYSSSGLNELAGEITELMHQHKGDDSFLIKMDTDEFLAYTYPAVLKQRFSVKALKGVIRRVLHALKGKAVDQDIRNYDLCVPDIHDMKVDCFDSFLEKLPVTAGIYKANYTVLNIPSHKDVTRGVLDVIDFGNVHATDFKSFFHSNGFRGVDLGGHRGRARNDKKLTLTGLVIIHYAYPTREIYAKRAKNVLISHGFLEATDSLIEQEQKLDLLKSQGETLSQHKILWYLDYLVSIREGKNIKQPANPRNRGNELTLVRDTIVRIRSEGEFPISDRINTDYEQLMQSESREA